jgi:hypothetical protein
MFSDQQLIFFSREKNGENSARTLLRLEKIKKKKFAKPVKLTQANIFCARKTLNISFAITREMDGNRKNPRK